jgi:hypothetical protein
MSMKTITKICSVGGVILLVFAALGPGKWVPRSGYGWQIDHFVCYFAFTSALCVAWPRALIVGAAMTVFAVLLEGLQAFTPDRIPDLHAALYSAGGVLAAALPADLFIRAPRLLNVRTILMPQFFMLRWASRIDGWTRLLRVFRRGGVPENDRVRSVGTASTGIGRPIAVTLTASRRIRQTI